MEGDGFFGKTEAWHVLEVEPNAKLIAGIKPNVTSQELADSIKDGTVVETVNYVEVKAGDTLFMSPGTIHALGPGLLIYEIQQTSDITYRVYDWGRPETETRTLHIDKALAVSDPGAASSVLALPQVDDGGVKTLTQCEYFKLETVFLERNTVVMDTRDESFHALTVIEGQVQVSAQAKVFVLNKFDTLLIPACCGAYQISPMKKSRVLKAGI